MIATHGILAEGFRNTLEILGVSQEHIIVMNFYCQDSHEEAEISELFASLSSEDQMIVFTDIQYGSVNQMFVKAAIRFREKNIEVLSGINLPLILEIAMSKGHLSKQELAESVVKASKEMVLMDLEAFHSTTAEEDIF